MKLKVCGMRDCEQLEALENTGVDFAGLIFYEGSKRFIGEGLKNKETEIRDLKIEKVGVFVNADIETIKGRIKEYGLNHVQLHGDENAAFCKQVKNFTSVIKAIRVTPGMNIEEELKKYEDACDYFLFDTHSSSTGGGQRGAYGGTGKQFDWNVLGSANIQKPFFLSGGIGLEDIDKIKFFNHPMLFAIDVNSRLEIEPGVKDLGKVKALANALK